MKQDKKLHVLAGFTIGVWIAPWSPLLAWLGLWLAALGREAANHYGVLAKKTGWDWRDIAYTVAGGALGIILALLVG